MSDETAFIDELDQVNDHPYPSVAVFENHPATPVIAKWRDELRYLSDRLLYARPTTADTLYETVVMYGEPRIRPLESQNERFDAADFGDLAPEASDQ